jgi:CelD/BcsL family acetyltransferase involved in cellulose biosynthesis
MMDHSCDVLKIEIIDSDEGFIALKNEWNTLTEKSINPSFYATYPFVFAAWKHYHREDDRLFILVVRQGPTLVGIAPFRIGKVDVGNIRLFKGMQLRVIRFIAEWGSGDKPAILTTESPECIWDRIFQFLTREFTHWDGIWLVEQPVNSPILTRNAVRKLWYSTSVVKNAPSFYTSITGTWEDYLKTRGKNTQRTWRRDTKKINNLPEGVKFQCFDTPETLPSALKRFIAIEQSGWKRNKSFSVGGNEGNRRFYEELLILLATQNMAAIYLLTSGTTDIAGKLIFKCHTTIYSAQVTYNPDFAHYSPGVLLTAELIKAFFGTRFEEFDFLGFRNDRKNDAKRNWSTGERATITIMVNKRNVRMVLFMQGTRLKTMLRNLVSFMTIYKPSEQ